MKRQGEGAAVRIRRQRDDLHLVGGHVAVGIRNEVADLRQSFVTVGHDFDDISLVGSLDEDLVVPRAAVDVEVVAVETTRHDERIRAAAAKQLDLGRVIVEHVQIENVERVDQRLQQRHASTGMDRIVTGPRIDLHRYAGQLLETDVVGTIERGDEYRVGDQVAFQEVGQARHDANRAA